MLGFPQPPRQEPEPVGIRAIVVVKEMYDTAGDDRWPNRFTIPPRIGDMVQSEAGRRLKVVDVVHSMESGYPVLMIEVGKDYTSNTATGGAGGSLE